jgi:hypothetical protein
VLSWPTPRQRILWDQIIRDAPEGLLRKLDSSMLETFIVAKSLHEEASHKIAQVGDREEGLKPISAMHLHITCAC